MPVSDIVERVARRYFAASTPVDGPPQSVDQARKSKAKALAKKRVKFGPRQGGGRDDQTIEIFVDGKTTANDIVVLRDVSGWSGVRTPEFRVSGYKFSSPTIEVDGVDVKLDSRGLKVNQNEDPRLALEDAKQTVVLAVAWAMMHAGTDLKPLS